MKPKIAGCVSSFREEPRTCEPEGFSQSSWRLSSSPRAVCFALAWRKSIPPEEAADRTAFDPDLVKRGAELAAVGNCTSCHTVPGGKSFAGGLGIPTPFGTIYSTNITPDPDTGIGRWSEAAFQRAMREGVDREGDHLYPAFPYDHFTRVTDEDNRALYAYPDDAASRCSATPPANDLTFPLNIRPLVAGWKLLYFDDGAFQPDPGQSDEWNRGAYLAEGLGHCGACHTPRNALGAEDARPAFRRRRWRKAGTPTRSMRPRPRRCRGIAESLAFYLRHGWHAAHGVSRGPDGGGDRQSRPASRQRHRRDRDLRRFADGRAVGGAAAAGGRARRGGRGATPGDCERGRGQPGGAATRRRIPAARSTRAPARPATRAGGALPFGGLNFALSTAVNAPNPQNIVNVTLFGLAAGGRRGERGHAGLRRGADRRADRGAACTTCATGSPISRLGRAWPSMARATRTGEFKVSIRPSDGIERAPANVGAED